MEVASKLVDRSKNLGFAVVAAFTGFTVFLIYADTEPVDAGAWIYVAVAAVIASAVWYFAVAKPLERESGNTPAKVGLFLGIIALLSNVVFWTGYDALLGAAALVLGMEGARRAQRGEGRAGMAKAATILGALNVVAFVGIMVAWAIAEAF